MTCIVSEPDLVDGRKIKERLSLVVLFTTASLWPENGEGSQQIQQIPQKAIKTREWKPQQLSRVSVYQETPEQCERFWAWLYSPCIWMLLNTL